MTPVTIIIITTAVGRALTWIMVHAGATARALPAAVAIRVEALEATVN
jgi:hypothetical protein